MNSRGDTIIEVLISIAIIALALGISYGLANRSLRTGISATNRAEASAINQGQIELLKNARAQLGSTEFQNAFRNVGGGYCLTVPAIPTDGNSYKSTSCTTSAIYNTQVSYGANGVFTITTTWASLSSGVDTDQLVMYYKVQQ